MQREPDGYLTQEAAAFLIPLHAELVDMVAKGATLTPVEKKDC